MMVQSFSESIFSCLFVCFNLFIYCVQGPGPQLIGRSVPSPSGVTGASSFDNTSASPLPYANSPRSGTGMMNTPSPQQQTQQQQQQQQQRKMMQLPQHQQQQFLAQQQMRQTSTPGGLGQVRFHVRPFFSGLLLMHFAY